MSTMLANLASTIRRSTEECWQVYTKVTDMLDRLLCTCELDPSYRITDADDRPNCGVVDFVAVHTNTAEEGGK